MDRTLGPTPNITLMAGFTLQRDSACAGALRAAVRRCAPYVPAARWAWSSTHAAGGAARSRAPDQRMLQSLVIPLAVIMRHLARCRAFRRQGIPALSASELSWMARHDGPRSSRRRGRGDAAQINRVAHPRGSRRNLLTREHLHHKHAPFQAGGRRFESCPSTSSRAPERSRGVPGAMSSQARRSAKRVGEPGAPPPPNFSPGVAMTRSRAD